MWELVVPAALAYGDESIKTNDKESHNVESGEALRFLIRLNHKT